MSGRRATLLATTALVAALGTVAMPGGRAMAANECGSIPAGPNSTVTCIPSTVTGGAATNGIEYEPGSGNSVFTLNIGQPGTGLTVAAPIIGTSQQYGVLVGDYTSASSNRFFPVGGANSAVVVNIYESPTHVMGSADGVLVWTRGDNHSATVNNAGVVTGQGSNVSFNFGFGTTINFESGFGINVLSEDADATVKNSGQVYGNNSGINVWSGEGVATVENSGLVRSQNGSGIAVGSPEFSGTVLGFPFSISLPNQGMVNITNSGEISALSSAGRGIIVSATDDVMVENTDDGMINSGNSGVEITTSGHVHAKNSGSIISLDGGGILALKISDGDPDANGNSVVVENVKGKIDAVSGPGVAVIAFDPDVFTDPDNAIVNNVLIENRDHSSITGEGVLLGPTVGVLADGAVVIKNDDNSTMTNVAGSSGLSGLLMGVIAGGNVEITNEKSSQMTGSMNVGSVGGSVVFSNGGGSSWASDGLSLLGALGPEQDVTINNERGGDITIGLNGTLALTAARDTTINNNRGADMTFLGSSNNVMVAGDDATINNDRGGSMNFLGISTNFMLASDDAEINNSRGGSFFMAGIGGNAMVAGDDARINNDSGGSFTMLGVNGNLMVAADSAEINNGAGGTVFIAGLNGQIMAAGGADGGDAIINNGQSSQDIDDELDGPAMMTFSGFTGNLMVAANDATINNVNGSTLTFEGLTASGMVAGDDATIYNDEDSVINFFGLNVFGFAGADGSRFTNYGTVVVDGITQLGTIDLLGNPLAGLDDFNNWGTVSMLDDDTDDYLFISGNYNAGSELAINAALTPGGDADIMNVRRNVTGVTELTVNDVDSGPGQYDPEGVLFAMVGGDTDTSNFTTNGGIDKGLYRYDTYLRLNDPNIAPGDDGWYLASTLDAEAYEFPIMMSGAQALWNASTGTWLDRTADLRVALGDGAVDPNCAKDCLPQQGNVTPGVWMKAVAGTYGRDAHNSSSPPPGLQGNSYDYDNSFDQDYWGFLIGADGGKEWTTESGHNAAWLVGLMGGYLGSNLDFDETATNVDYEAFTVGLYTTFMHGGFFVDGTLKADFGTMDYDSDLGGGFSDDFSSDFTSIGGLVDMGYRMNIGTGAFFEPLATLSYVSTSIDDNEVLGSDVSFDDGESLQGRLGARLGASLAGDAMRTELFIEGSVWNEFMGEYNARLTSNGFDVDTEFDAGGAYGEVALGANVFGASNNWNGFVTGAVQFGDDEFLGYSGNVGLRYNW